jgi:hypothetical protein
MKLRGYSSDSTKRIAKLKSEEISEFLHRLPPQTHKNLMGAFPIPKGFRPGQPKTIKKQIEMFVEFLRHPERAPKRAPIFATMEHVWMAYAHDVLKFPEEVHAYQEAINALDESPADVDDLIDADIKFVRSIISSAGKYISSDDFIYYCNFAPFTIDQATIAEIKSNLPSRIAITKERQLDELSGKLRDLESQFHQVSDLLDVEGARILSVEKKITAGEQSTEILQKDSKKQIQLFELMDAKISQLINETRENLSQLNGFSNSINGFENKFKEIELGLIEDRKNIGSVKLKFEELNARQEELSTIISNLPDFNLEHSDVACNNASTADKKQTSRNIIREAIPQTAATKHISKSTELRKALNEAWESIGIRKSWRDTVSLILLTSLKSGAILVLRGDLRDSYAKNLAAPIASVIEILSVPVGTIEVVDENLMSDDQVQGLSVQIIQRVNLSQSELAIPGILAAVRQSLVNKHVSQKPILRIATAGSGGLFVEPEPELAFLSIGVETDVIPFENFDATKFASIIDDNYLLDLAKSNFGKELDLFYEEMFNPYYGGAFRKNTMKKIYSDMNYVAENILQIASAEKILKDIYFCTVCFPRLAALGMSRLEVKALLEDLEWREVLDGRIGKCLFDAEND